MFRTVRLWIVKFSPRAVLEGEVNVVADDAEDAIRLIKDEVEKQAGPGTFELELLAQASITPLYDDRDPQGEVLWDDASSVSDPKARANDVPGAVETHNGKQYQQVTRLPVPEDMQLDSEHTVESDAAERERDPGTQNEAEGLGATLLKQAREETIIKRRILLSAARQTRNISSEQYDKLTGLIGTVEFDEAWKEATSGSTGSQSAGSAAGSN